MRYRAVGVLFVLSGTCFVAGVLDPPLLSTWGGSETYLIATASAHRTAWLASTWLITLSIVAGLAGFVLLTRIIDTDLARIGLSLYVVGSALGLASTTFDLAVSSTLLGRGRLPSWYLGSQLWADGLGTAYFALLAPVAMGCLGVAILRTRALAAWEGYVLVTAMVLLLGQFAAFHGALPFPQFIAFIALGVACLVPRAPETPPGRQPHDGTMHDASRSRQPSATHDSSVSKETP